MTQPVIVQCGKWPYGDLRPAGLMHAFYTGDGVEHGEVSCQCGEMRIELRLVWTGKK